MTHNHPIWMEQADGAAEQILSRLAPTGEERAEFFPTERERAYQTALETLYGNTPAATGKSKDDRDDLYRAAMKRLHEKDLLSREKISHAYVYAPAVERDEFRRTMVEDALEPVLDGKSESMIAAFVDLAERAGEDTLARLEQLVAQRRQKGGGPE